MKIYQTNEIKNIALLGNARSGKTTLAETMLFEGGVIERRGDVETKNTVSDYHEIEHINTSSVFSTVLYTEWKNKKINIIDNPGSDDFVSGAISSFRAADSALMLINAQNGIEVGTEIHLRHAEASNFPLIFAINHLDHDKANYDKSIEGLKEVAGTNLVQVQFPVNAGEGFDSIIDVLTMKLYKFKADGGKADVLDIPDDLKEKADELHNELVEKAAENDESLMELFFENESLTEDEMRKGIALGLIQRGIFPVFCISAKKNMGIQRLMDFICNVAPSAVDMPPVKNTDGKEVKCDPKGATSLFVFKTTVEEHIGEVNYFKVLSGEVGEGMDLIDQFNSTKERFSQLLVSAGKKRNKVTKIVAGDIGAAVKLKSTKTNHTLNAAGNNWELEKINFPPAKFRAAIKTKSEGEEERMGDALSKMHDQDLTIIVEYSKELKQIIIHGQGEHHLNTLKWHLDNVYKIETEFITPKIPYRETITKIAQADYRHKKQSGGAGQFGEVHLIIEPYIEGAPDPKVYKVLGKDLKINVRDKEEFDLDWGGKLVYYNCIVGGSIDTRFLPAILKGIMEKMEEGPLTGSYARDIKVAVYDGKMHPVDSNEISFKLAGRNAFSMAFKNAGPKIMEPVYDVEVLVPSDRMGDVMSDLQGRRAVVQGMSSEKRFEKISAKVPLAELSKYSTALSSITGGRAIYTMQFAEYSQVPGDLQKDLLKAYEEEQNKE